MTEGLVDPSEPRGSRWRVGGGLEIKVLVAGCRWIWSLMLGILRSGFRLCYYFSTLYGNSPRYARKHLEQCLLDRAASCTACARQWSFRAISYEDP